MHTFLRKKKKKSTKTTKINLVGGSGGQYIEASYRLPGLPGDLYGKESACNAGDQGSIPGSGRYPGERNGNPLQYSCLENPMDRETWWATVHGVTKSRTQLSDSHTHTHTHNS